MKNIGAQKFISAIGRVNLVLVDPDAEMGGGFISDGLAKPGSGRILGQRGNRVAMKMKNFLSLVGNNELTRAQAILCRDPRGVAVGLAFLGLDAGLREVFNAVWAEEVIFANPLQGDTFTQTVYLARTSQAGT